MRRRAGLPAVMLAVVLVAGCGDDDEAERATQTEAPKRPAVEMNDALQFDPKTITVSVGDRVEWPNVGKVAHTVTTTPSKVADRGKVEVPTGAQAWDSGLIGEGERYARTFEDPGTYRYACIPHEGAGMLGTVTVEE